MVRVNSHAKLMRWRLEELRDLAADNARKLGDPIDALPLDKRTLAHLVMAQAKKLSAREGRQGE